MRILDVILTEANFDIKKRAEGTVVFPTSSLNDPHIKKALKSISSHTRIPLAQLVKEVEQKVEERSEMATKSPILYETLNQNSVEDIVFTKFWETGVPVKKAPKFNNVIFNKLVRRLRVEYDEFFPLRGYVDKQHLLTPVINILEPDTPLAKEIPTAAASPKGVFYFNREFMQSLLNYASLKGVKPKADKYKSNGGKFPDEYAWIEFIIMHEFMHYSNDDFYYQKIIPNANPKIINWVGDFRTNYLLTKSGFEPLPMGLFNDKINYDRQNEYVEMYNIVKEEFEKLNPDEQDMIKQIMDQLSDHHEKGNQDGEASDVTPEDATPEELDDNAERNASAVGEEEEDADAKESGDPSDEQPDPNRPEGERGQKDPKSRDVDYSKITPQFNWKGLIDKFIKSGAARTEETYSKPHRRSITSVDVARQVGAAAIKPAEKPVDYSDAKLFFLIDNSGSMGWVIKPVLANAVKLLKNPMFRKSLVLVCKYSSASTLHKVNVAGNKAGKVDMPSEMPKVWDKTAEQVFSAYAGGGTEITSKIGEQAKAALREGYNIVMFTDTDIMWSHNLPILKDIIKTAPKQVFIIFDTRDSWLEFRRKTGINTPNITYFSEIDRYGR